MNTASRLIIFLALLLTACKPQIAATPSETSNAASTEHTYTSWAGKWNGVEGTYLTITPNGPRHYKITIADLDGPKTFPGEDREHGIEFIRDGKPEQLHAGNGSDTGMKWLADKKDCLYTHKGEGWCRD